jgi:poly(hydroxyalkanoate) depolymerase family esterase
MTQDTHTTDGSTGFNRRTVLKTVGVSAAAATGVAGMNAASAAAGTYTGESYNGRYYGKYVPSGYDGSEAVPLVMMLHGCTQTGDGFKDETQMNQVAEQEGFIAIYPEETEGINSCWNWFEDSNTLRGQGQVQELAEGIVGQVESNETIDSDRVYVAGFSAGAYMVPNLVVEYADVFAAGAIHSGGQYDIAETKSEGNQVIGSCSTGSSADPGEEGQHAYDRMEQLGIDDYLIPTIVFHGTDDYTVSKCQGDIAAEQATVTNDLLDDDTDNATVDYSADATNSGSGSDLSYTEYEYRDSKGRNLVEHYVINGMGHAWSGGSYTAPGGPNASQIAWDFFSNWDNALNDAPNADISASSTNVSTGDTVDFDGSDSTDPDGSIASYEWDFGDGTTATGATASHSYSSGGVYDVTLTVTDDKGATGTATVSITADAPGNDAPSVDIEASATSITEGDTVDFDGSGSSDVDGSIDSYEWDFTNDGTTDASGPTASHTYESPGTVEAKLTLIDNDGGVSSATVTIDVGEFNGYCGTEYPYVHEDNGRAESQSDGSYEAVGSGDDLGFGGSKVTVKETSEGYYEKVSSCDDSGDDGGDDGGNTAPSASFSASSTTVNTGDSVDFDGSGSSDSDGSISSYEWDFGDGSTATGETASHSYSSADDYTVTLTVTDDDGATDSTSTTITVESSGGSDSCTTATLSDHVDAGRAYYSWGYYYATGSGQYLGFSGSTTVSLDETSDGYYEEVNSC